MEREPQISKYRERLDKTLASNDLTNEETIKSLVKKQLLHSAKNDSEGEHENILGTRTKEVSNFLDMLRSASGYVDDLPKTNQSSQTEWKLKQDSKDFRVMYREGPQGTPFHTLLVEGYVDGPMDACLCVSWETSLYKKWWPQYNVPAFKIISSECLQNVGIGEHLSLVRMKVSWPLSAREALVHYFAFEYFQDDLIIILINTISDLKNIDKSTHGFSRDGLPEAQDIVRIDLVGGFAIQKVTQERSYFRTIITMDVKLDFVPPTLINFISRQLIGSGFKLYQKAVASVSTVAKRDEDFSKALRGPLYDRIRKELYSTGKITEILETVDLKNETDVLPEKHVAESMEDDISDMNPIVPLNKNLIKTSGENAVVFDQIPVNEIEEEEEEFEESKYLEEDGKVINDLKKFHVDEKWNLCVSTEVKQALNTLENVIFMARELRMNTQTRPLKDLSCSENGERCSNGIGKLETLKEESMEIKLDKPWTSTGNDNSRVTGLNSNMGEVSNNKIAPLQIPSESPQVDLVTSKATKAPNVKKSPNANANAKQDKTEVNGNHESNSIESKKSKLRKKKRLCGLLGP